MLRMKQGNVDQWFKHCHNLVVLLTANVDRQKPASIELAGILATAEGMLSALFEITDPSAHVEKDSKATLIWLVTLLDVLRTQNVSLIKPVLAENVSTLACWIILAVRMPNVTYQITRQNADANLDSEEPTHMKLVTLLVAELIVTVHQTRAVSIPNVFDHAYNGIHVHPEMPTVSIRTINPFAAADRDTSEILTSLVRKNQDQSVY